MSTQTVVTSKTPEMKSGTSISVSRKPEQLKLGNTLPDQIAYLQRTIGNQTIGRLLQQGAFQAKLTVSQPGDIQEQEADQVAEEVMRMPEPGLEGEVQRHCGYCSGAAITRKPDDEEEAFQTQTKPGQTLEVTEGTQARIDSLRGGGEPLSEQERAFFEPRFGCDFSGVRVHTGNDAAESARLVNARAYTVGRDVVFDAGEYRPGTGEGKRLMAHELTHVVQQGGPANSGINGVLQREAGVQSLSCDLNFNNIQPMYPNDKPALDFTVIRRNLYDIVIAIGRNFDLAQALSQTPRLSNLAYGLQCLYTAIRRYINNRNESDFATLEYIIKLAKYIHVLSSSCQIPDCANLMDELAIYTWYFQNVFYGLLVKAALEQLGFKDHNNSVGEALKSFKGAIQWNENSSETFFNNYLAICVKANITNRMIDNQPNPDFFSKDNYSEKGYIQLPNEGTGYRSNCRDNNDNWGTPEFVKTLIDIAAQWNRLFPEIMIYYGDLSRKEGGPLAPHKSHQQGVQTDLTFRRGNIKISNMDLETYRQNYCTEFVKLLESFPIINEIFFGDAATGAKVIAGHRNHFHIGSRNR